MQINADFGQLLVAVEQQTGFGTSENILLCERLKLGVDALRLGQPQQGVDVAQAAGGGFDVGFQHRTGALRFGVALLLL